MEVTFGFLGAFYAVVREVRGLQIGRCEHEMEGVAVEVARGGPTAGGRGGAIDTLRLSIDDVVQDRCAVGFGLTSPLWILST
jgi:hypothetical protein